MIGTLISNDIRYIKKDPMYWIIFILPIILGCVYNFLVLDIEIVKPFFYVAQYFFILAIPMMVGMVFGFRLLDEKDERVLSVYAVSPLGIKWYIAYRIIQCLVLSFLELIIIILFGIVPQYNSILSILIAISLAPCIFLILGILGKNKIQGMTLLKLIGTVIMIPVLQVIGKNKWDIFFKLLPTDFILKTTIHNMPIYVGIIYAFEILLAIYFMLNYFYKKCTKDI